MLRFVNKKGKQVMEIRDNGDILIEDAELKQELALQEGVVIEEVKDEAEKKDEV